MATLDTIEARIEKLQAQADALKKKRAVGVVAQIHSLMSEYGLSLEDLGSTSDGRKVGGKAATKNSSGKSPSVAKYEDPKSGATWSGHGRAPGWLANARNRDRFLIDNSAPTTATAPKSVKSDNYRRGPQPALYRDPTSGKTWSGRGMAPGWLASAKDRTKFLINGAANTKTATAKGALTIDAKNSGSADKAVASAPANKLVARKAASSQKAATKKGSATSTKTSAGKTAAGKKSTAAAKKAPQVASKKVAGKKTAATRALAKKSSNVTEFNAVGSVPAADAVSSVAQKAASAS
ncbi:H-NS family nucleoid-associated regulatory protein [Caballeronia sp. LZ062]|uniref:H-NS family nucleoid-associated regulatory protein n=1 Tax=unclassified Caballeronia TaxID=2646786 RepID=UPI00286728A8|nr:MULTISPECIES: H-NS family nucleoid-associated regulatory protein [unclassified Caballeronia]MDR5855717.1 H-NS family nucleoid-associated regulatory protein [Caballeronia sp. LZ050]MDR5872496.1 H-NS family nucleoid-associated regulatory protein [Caballeronia sp. LZ062]